MSFDKWKSEIGSVANLTQKETLREKIGRKLFPSQPSEHMSSGEKQSCLRHYITVRAGFWDRIRFLITGHVFITFQERFNSTAPAFVESETRTTTDFPPPDFLT